MFPNFWCVIHSSWVTISGQRLTPLSISLFVQVLEIPIYYENFDEAEGSPECEFIPRSLPKQPDPDAERKVIQLVKTNLNSKLKQSLRLRHLPLERWHVKSSSGTTAQIGGFPSAINLSYTVDKWQSSRPNHISLHQFQLRAVSTFDSHTHADRRAKLN